MPTRLRILWVTPHLPIRGIAAARERWWHLLEALAARHDVTLVAFVDPEDAERTGELPPGLRRVEPVARPPWRPDDPLALLPQTVAGGFSYPGFADAIAAALRRDAFDLVQYEYQEMAHLMPWPGPPTVVTVQQLGFAQQAARLRAEGGGPRQAAVFFHRYLRELDFELRAVAQADHVVTMSAEDAARIRAFHPDLPVSVSPCGVDPAWFRPDAVAPAAPADLLFVGNFVHPPNRDAVRFLARDVLPALDPSVRLRVVGHGAATALPDLAGAPRIELVGPVPDVRPHLASARVVVAPVRFGTGMRGKVLEALAMARPVVTTPLGAEGLDARPDHHLVVADGADATVRAIASLLADRDRAERIGAAGRELVTTRFAWGHIAAAHDAIYARTLAEPRRAARRTGAPPAALQALARRLGRLPGAGLGTGLLAWRALGWHLRRWRAHPPAARGRRLVRPAAA